MTLTKKELLAAVKLCNDAASHKSPATRTATNLARLRKLRYCTPRIVCPIGTVFLDTI